MYLCEFQLCDLTKESRRSKDKYAKKQNAFTFQLSCVLFNMVAKLHLLTTFLKDQYRLWYIVKPKTIQSTNQMFLGTYLNINDELGSFIAWFIAKRLRFYSCLTVFFIHFFIDDKGIFSGEL